jgi:hypothetical protein
MSYKSSQHVLEERKLAEESDNKLTELLFSDSPSKNQENDIKTVINKNMSKPSVTLKKGKIAGNKEITEQKQKDLAIKNKNRKHVLHKKREIFGEYEYDDNNYVEYCEIEEKYLD